ncbi:MAG TPA: nitrophenyl compound nitroreductase subunit ArsF family protein [Chitinispirillaceae bacterium]|nr:nitrophenyl compound nitroreductase subunit ArsF family protein [Chitinispirillaceae bacterium]
MNSKKQFSNGLVFGLSILFFFVSCQAEQPKPQKSPSAKVAASAKTDTVDSPIVQESKIIVYYFHSNARCPTCYKLENYAKSEVESDFADVLKSGKLEWKSVNVEDKGNEHFNDDYKLYTKSVIISTLNNGRESSWKNLDQIWQIVHDEGAYREYIKKEAKACLEGKCL